MVKESPPPSPAESLDDAPAEAAPAGPEALQRRYGLMAVLWSATLAHADGVEDCVIVSVSANGAMVQLDRPPQCGAQAILKSAHFGELPGEVCWLEGNRAGIEFHEDPSMVAAVLGAILPPESEPDERGG